MIKKKKVQVNFVWNFGTWIYHCSHFFFFLSTSVLIIDQCALRISGSFVPSDDEGDEFHVIKWKIS